MPVGRRRTGLVVKRNPGRLFFGNESARASQLPLGGLGPQGYGRRPR
jgi:hypothetical protein